MFGYHRRHGSLPVVASPDKLEYHDSQLRANFLVAVHHLCQTMPDFSDRRNAHRYGRLRNLICSFGLLRKGAFRPRMGGHPIPDTPASGAKLLKARKWRFDTFCAAQQFHFARPLPKFRNQRCAVIALTLRRCFSVA
jgi:hypothetical protein